MQLTRCRLSSIYVLDQDQALDFDVEDVDSVHAELVEHGVEITQPPTDQGYGRDMGLRDPFGNHLRIGRMHA